MAINRRAPARFAKTSLVILISGALHAVWAGEAAATTPQSTPNAPMSAAHARSDSEAQALRSGFSPRALRALFGDRAGQIDFAKLQAESEVGRRQFDVYVNDRFVSRQNVELYHRPDGSIGVRVQAMALLIQDL